MEKITTPKQALERAKWLCAKQERCQSEIYKKLKEWGIEEENSEEIITQLIIEKFIDEKRFAQLYSRSKFNQLKWGKIKISHELKQKGISEKCIQYGLQEIDNKVYIKTLQKEIEKKTKELKENNTFILKNKLIKYFYSKGYESELTIELLK
ncbi:MAG: regulatory protein RecX [Bacteroidota bacterium]|jgi:regulatory protein